MALVDAAETGNLARGGLLEIEGEIVSIKLSIALFQFDGDVVPVKIEGGSKRTSRD